MLKTMRKAKERPFLDLGRKIAELRHAHGWSQEELASKSGVAISALKDIERGVSEGYFSTRTDIAKALGCQIADFYVTNDLYPLSDADLGRAVKGLIAAKPLRRAILLFLATRDRAFLERFSDKEIRALESLDLIG